MATCIHLLGAPCIERNGASVPPPRGGKSWALLAYLLLMARPVPRPRLAQLLFEEADDPAAALRWTLSQVRRALGSGALIGGDPVAIDLAARTVVDVDVVTSGSWQQALALPGFGGELLEGVTPRVGPAFELWLSTERRRLAGATQAILHGAAHSRLAAGDTAAAVGLAARLVGGDPLDESAHELLVRALVAAGDRTAAEEQVARCSALFQRELGVAPSPALSDALFARPAPSAAGTRGAVLAQIEAGDATAHAGAYDLAVQVLRSAAGAARQLGEDQLVGRSLAALGAALVEGVRGADEEGMSVLHEAVLLARRAGDRPTAARAAQEIEHVETLRARYAAMEVWSARARELADGAPRLLAWTEVYTGLGRTDQADYAGAVTALESAVQLARSAEEWRALAYALTGLGRLRLLRGEVAAARVHLDAACATARRVGYTSFLAFPESLLAEVDLLEGDLVRAAGAFEHSYALACQVGDPCWESYSLRGRGLLAAASGDDRLALELLVAAPEACRRLNDTHDWVQAYCLDALAGFAVSRRLDRAPASVDQLEDFTSRRGMRELVARAAVHRVELRQPGAEEVASFLVETIDNPALQQLWRRVRGRQHSAAP